MNIYRIIRHTPFLDDWVAPAPTRWKLRRAIKLVNQTLNAPVRAGAAASCSA